MYLTYCFIVIMFAIVGCFDIDLQASNLTAIPENLSITVTNLFLADNVITEVGEQSLSHYTLLATLDLTRNEVSFIHSMAFRHSSKLHQLNLGSNSVRLGIWLEPLFLNLSSLLMPRNGLVDLHQVSWLQFEHLTRLILSNNDAGPLINGTLLPNTLLALRLIHCHIEKMTNITHLEHIRTFYIQHNDMNTLLDLSHMPLDVHGLSIAGKKLGVSHYRDHILYAHRNREMTLHFIVVSHWFGVHTK